MASVSDSHPLTPWGWSDRVAELAAAVTGGPEAGEVGRLFRVERGMDMVRLADRDVRPSRAHLLYRQADHPRPPATGDWVVVTEDDGEPVITTLLDPFTVITRRDPQDRDQRQVVVSNADVALIVHGLDRPINPRRLERALIMILDGGASAALVLTKADLIGDGLAGALEAAEGVAGDLPIHVVSNLTGAGLEALDGYRTVDGVEQTIALLGESGSGKSSLTNRLVGGEVQEIGEVRQRDAKGRHTTVSRDLIPLPGGGIVVDTPGVRGLGLWNAEDGLDKAFPDVERHAGSCRFADCTHDREPSCSVRAAVEGGELSAVRHHSYLDLVAELEALRQRQEQQERREGEGRRPRRRRSGR